MSRRKRKKVASLPKKEKVTPLSTWRLFQWLATTGFLLAGTGVAYQYWAGNFQLEYIQSLSRGYEFQIKNDTPADRLIKEFRIVIPMPQQVVYQVTKDIYAKRSINGEVILPGGNITYVPAAEFKELDGRKVVANSSIKFRVPPLSSRSWMEPEASIVDVRFKTIPNNRVLQMVEVFFTHIGLLSIEQTIRYLILGNYWVVSQSSSLNEAIRIACRDDEIISRTSTCKDVLSLETRKE